MPLKSYLIAPYQTGQQNDVEPFLLPEDAFQILEDCYVWRGKVRKRFGYNMIGTSDLLSRLRINVGTTAAGTGNLVATIMPGTIWKVGQMFSVGTTVFTVATAGAAPNPTLTTGTATADFDTTNGTLIITGNGENPATSVFFYPAEPVMGLRTRELSTVNFEDTIAFDTQFAYERTGGAWVRIAPGVPTAADIWTGSNSQFFWSVNYRGANPYNTVFYTVNFNRADHIRYLTSGSSAWVDLRPQLDSGATRFLDSARLLLGYKDRLIALNTLETDGGGTRTYGQRVRFSQNGDPTATATSWLDDVRGRGGYIDAPTQQQIITADIIKDRLVVYFERSTWELLYTGFPDAPFRWQQLNNELGCESTFSVIGFDDAILGVGNVGVHSCNGVNVNRIDQKIPDEVYQIHNGNNGPERVYGIRDYVPELAYWAFPDEDSDPTFPTRVLVYNYKNATWAIFNDSFTCFGYFQKDTDLTWAVAGGFYPSWAVWNSPWDSGREQSAFPDIIAGNQEGFVMTINPDSSTNSQSLYITNITTATDSFLVVDHNLKQDDYVFVEDVQGITSGLNDLVFRVKSITDSDNFILDVSVAAPIVGTYTGGGKLSRVSNLNILTKQFNPGTPIGQEFRVPYMDFLINTTTSGEVSLDSLVDSNIGSTVADNAPAGVLLGNNVLITRPDPSLGSQTSQQYIWHRFFIQSEAEFIQFRIFMSDDQMKDRAIATAEFILQAMMIYVEPSGRITG